MNCTKCDKFLSKCDVILHYSEELFECPYCNHKFCINESTDYEWEKWINSFCDIITRDHCISWILGDAYDKKKIENELVFEDFIHSPFVEQVRVERTWRDFQSRAIGPPLLLFHILRVAKDSNPDPPGWNRRC